MDTIRRLQGVAVTNNPKNHALETALVPCCRCSVGATLDCGLLQHEFFNLLDKDHDHSIDRTEWQTIFSDISWVTPLDLLTTWLYAGSNSLTVCWLGVTVTDELWRAAGGSL